MKSSWDASSKLSTYGFPGFMCMEKVPENPPRPSKAKGPLRAEEVSETPNR